MDTTNKLSPDGDANTETFHRSHGRTWAGNGRGGACDLCGQPISAEQIEYEVELEDPAERQTVLLHFACYQRWLSTQP